MTERVPIPRPKKIRVETKDPWLGCDPLVFEFEKLTRAVEKATPVNQSQSNSAVLIPIYRCENEVRMVLTRRSANLSSHPGQVAFPGGRIDPGETPMQAALREAYEEVGLNPDDVRIIGKLENLTASVSSSVVEPFVGLIDGELGPLVPSPDEVARIFTVGLAELTQAGVFHEEYWWHEESKADIAITFFTINDETIWGATGRLVRNLLDLCTQG